MRLPAGQVFRAVYEETGGPSVGRSVELLADPAGRFALRDRTSGRESRCEGTTVWAQRGGVAEFVGPVPPEGSATFSLLPPLLGELLHSESAYLHAAFADPSTTDEELDRGQVRISGSDLTIVYDRSIDVVYEYLRPDGLQRRLVDVDVAPTPPGTSPWAGPVPTGGGGTARITTTGPVGRVEDALAAPCFTAHLEYDSDVLCYWLDGPAHDGSGLALAACLDWAQAFDADVQVSVDLLSGETVALPASR